jgi:hypothetical protein
MEIRSYRRVFDLERRLYRIDRLRLNPGGVPVRGIIYLLVLLAGALIAGSLPLVGTLGRALPWYVRDVALPGASATILCMIRVEGRPFHLAALALLQYRLGPRHLDCLRPCRAVGTRWLPSEIVLLPDGSDSRMRRLRYTGPGAVLIAIEHEGAGRVVERGPVALARLLRRPDITVKELPQARVLNCARVISLEPNARLLVQPSGAAEARR